MRKLFFLIGLMFGICGGACHAQNIDSLVAYYQRQAQLYLVKSQYLHNFFSIDKNGIAMYASPSKKKKKQAEITLPWHELETFKKLIKYADRNYQFQVYKTKGTKPFSESLLDVVNILEQNHQYFPIVEDKPLAGLKIAIDPGHIAGDFDMAVAESRFIDMRMPDGKKIRFFEGELTLTTAMMLRDSLVNAGAEVFMSREKPNQSANGQLFEEWLNTSFKSILRRKGFTNAQIADYMKTTSKGKIYRDYFLNMDLDARADVINYFKPHFTIVIHFNVDANNLGWRKPSKASYNLIFVPGSFLQNELYTQISRFDFLRILLTDFMPESTKLSQFVLNEFDKKLDVPAVQSYEEPFYLRNYSMKVEEGIYARNIRLCRLLNTPICYGESLLQDNELELTELSKNDYKNGVYAPRLVQVANAYYKGVLRYSNYLKQKENKISPKPLVTNGQRPSRAE